MTAPLIAIGYTGIGSFHTDTFEELVDKCESATYPKAVEAAYERGLQSIGECALPWPTWAFSDKAAKITSLDADWSFLNHGAFGSPAVPLIEVAQAWRIYVEQQPLRFIDRELLPFLASVTVELAEFLDVARDTIFLVQNATTALNAAIFGYAAEARKLSLTRKVVIICLSISYGSVKTLCKEAARTFEGESVVLKVPARPPSIETFVQSFEEELAAAMEVHGKIDICCLDMITSNTALVLPVERLCRVCREHGVRRIVIDAAHALGQVQLLPDRLGCDALVSNAHKWLMNVRGSAFLYLREGRASNVRNRIVSHGFEVGISSSFVWDGAKDYSPLLTLPFALRMWRLWTAGEERNAMIAISKRARSEAERIAEAWKTEVMAPSEMTAAMLCVRLPELERSFDIREKLGAAHAKTIQDWLHINRKIECPVKCIDESLYVRLSFTVYNTKTDVDRLIEAIQDLQLIG